MFKDQWEVCDFTNDHDVDFRRGRVKGVPTICFIRDFREECPLFAGEASDGLKIRGME